MNFFREKKYAMIGPPSRHRLLEMRQSFVPTMSSDAFHGAHLRIGDVISLYSLDNSLNAERHEGFLSTLGYLTFLSCTIKTIVL